MDRNKFEVVTEAVIAASTDKIEILLSHGPDMTENDFLDLAVVALDQAGVSLEDQFRIAAILTLHKIRKGA